MGGGWPPPVRPGGGGGPLPGVTGAPGAALGGWGGCLETDGAPPMFSEGGA